MMVLDPVSILVADSIQTQFMVYPASINSEIIIISITSARMLKVKITISEKIERSLQKSRRVYVRLAAIFVG